MITALSCAAGASAVLAILAEWEERRHAAFYLFKPLTTLLMLVLAASLPAHAGPSLSHHYQHFVVAALALSMAGDVCLLFDGELFFVGGLSSFLLAHGLFIAAFLEGIRLAKPPGWTLALPLYGVTLFIWLWRRVGALRGPVAAYCLVLLAMACAAVLRWSTLHNAVSARAMAGALLFVVSDSALAVRKFGDYYHGAQLLILSSYWGALALITASI